MKIYTSSYYKYRGNRGVQIFRSKPTYAKVYRSLPTLYPSWDSIKKWNNVRDMDVKFVQRIRTLDKCKRNYWEYLSKVGPDRVLSLLSDGDVLLCWGGKSTECHRSVLAEWLRQYGVEVEEI